MKIEVINLKAYDDPKAIYIGRPSVLGNKFSVERYGRAECISMYRKWLNTQIHEGNPVVCAELNRIADKAQEPRGVKLKCFCKPLACHGDVIKEIVETAIKGGIIYVHHV